MYMLNLHFLTISHNINTEVVNIRLLISKFAVADDLGFTLSRNGPEYRYIPKIHAYNYGDSQLCSIVARSLNMGMQFFQEYQDTALSLVWYFKMNLDNMIKNSLK